MEPVRCFTCNAVLNFKRYEECTLQHSMSRTATFETMGAYRFCCRRMYLSHPTELEEHIRSYPMRNVERNDYSMKFEVVVSQDFSTD